MIYELDNKSLIADIHSDILMFYSQQDYIIPYDHGLQLLQYSGTNSEKLREFEGPHRAHPLGKGGIDEQVLKEFGMIS